MNEVVDGEYESLEEEYESLEEKEKEKEKEKEENPKYKEIVLKIMENIPEADEFYSKIEKNQRGKINPRIPGIFILFDNIDFYFLNFHRYQFFDNNKKEIPQTIEESELLTIINQIKEYIKKYTNIQDILESNYISFDDIVSDYILFFISKKEKLIKDSCDIKYIYKIISRLIEIKKINEKLEGFEFFISIIILFNIYNCYITYPLNAIKFLNDENIIQDIYDKILKQISLYEKQSDVIFIIIESFFEIIINEILLKQEIIEKFNYIHLFLMNIINTLNLKCKNFYIYMQFKSLYNLIKTEESNKLLNNVYSEIYKLKSIFSKEIQREETLKAYSQFYEKLRTDYKISNYPALRNFIIDFFTYEIKKYQKNEELIAIILDVLTENNGDAFVGSKKIFNIILEKYVFDKAPQTINECRKIIEQSYQIKKYIENDENFEEKDKFIKFHEEQEIKEENEYIKHDKIKMANDSDSDEDSEEKHYEKIKKREKNIILNDSFKYTEDLFLKKYNEIITTKGNEKIKVIIDEIIQQYFGYYFNGYFTSFSNEENYDITFLDSNKVFLKTCIKYLENLKQPFTGREISIFLSNAFIQSFLYIFIDYFYSKLSLVDKKYDGEYDLKEIFKIIEGNTPFRRVVQIYVFRLLFYKIGNFDEFKKFLYENKALSPFVKQFTQSYSFEDPPFRLEFYCKKMYEDFFNDEERSLPNNFKLNEYEFDDMFPYDSNIINIKMINKKEVVNGSINSYENNLLFVTRMAVLIISNASEHLISKREFISINTDINKIFKKHNKYINTLFNDAMFELAGNLHLNLIKELKEILLKDTKKGNEEFIPEIILPNFISDDNNKDKYNERTLGIFLYALKISLTIFIFDESEKYFYSYLLITENSSDQIINILENSIIPGYNSSKIGLNNQEDDYDQNFLGISSLTLRFILFSNLFFITLTKKLEDENIKKYCASNKYNKNEKYSCLQMLFYIWNILDKKLMEDGIIIEIYFNLVNKYLPYILKKCTIETVQSKEKVEDFVSRFDLFIQACLNNYKEYSLNFINYKMRYIIQELNNPLKYDFDEFPFLKYYTVQSKPKKKDIINKIGNDNKYLILNSLKNIEPNTQEKFIKFFPLFNIGKYFVNYLNGELILSVKGIEEYSKLFKILNSQFGKINNIEDKIIKLKTLDSYETDVNKLISESNKKISELINDNIKYEESYKYLFYEIYDTKEITNIFETEFMNFNLSQISGYKQYTLLINDYIYRNNFQSDYRVDYFNYRKFNINCNELDEILFSLLLFNKKIFLYLNNSKKFYIPNFDYFNAKTNNQYFLSNYLTEYPSREELTKEQIQNINESFLQIIETEYSKIVSDKSETENELKEKNEKIRKEINEKLNLIENNEKDNDNNNIDNNINNEDIDYLKYEQLLYIKKLEEEIEQNEFIIDLLNYQYNQIISSAKVNYIIDICFGLQSLFYYIYDIKIDENIPLFYICNNLPLLKCQKNKLVNLFRKNTEINLSHLLPLYEYFESLIFIEFVYHINKGYFEPLPLYIGKKLLYFFEKDEMKNNIIFTKIEFIEAIKKCLCRYIASAIIKDDIYTEDLENDLFSFLIKEDLWRKNIEMKKLKESFNFIYNYINFKIKMKHIFNLFEILIEINNKDYLSFDNYKEQENEKKEEKDILHISEIIKNIPKFEKINKQIEPPQLMQNPQFQMMNMIQYSNPMPNMPRQNPQFQMMNMIQNGNPMPNMPRQMNQISMKVTAIKSAKKPYIQKEKVMPQKQGQPIQEKIFQEQKEAVKEEIKKNEIDKNNEEEQNDSDLDKNKDATYENDEIYNKIKNRKKYIFEQLEKSKLIFKYLESIKEKEKEKNKNNNYLNHLNNELSKDLIKEVIKFGSLFDTENLIPRFNKFITKPKINIKFSYIEVKKDILLLKNEIKNIILFNKNKLMIIYKNGTIDLYSFDKKTFRYKTNFEKLEIDNLESINNINKINCMKELIDGNLLLGTNNGHIMKLKPEERKKNNKTSYVLQLLDDIKVENKKIIEDLIEINLNIFVSKDEENIKIWKNNKIIKHLEKGDIIKTNNYLIIINSSLIFYDIKNFKEISKIDKKIINPTLLNEKILIGEDNFSSIFQMIDIEEKKIIKEKEYKPGKNFILKKICKKWAVKLDKGDNAILIKIDLINKNNNYDVVCNNKESLTIESSEFLTNLFDEFFITSSEGKISCYGCFLDKNFFSENSPVLKNSESKSEEILIGSPKYPKKKLKKKFSDDMDS